MSALKRNIVLSNKNSKNNQMAILTLEKLSSGNFATLKMFNISEDNLMLAISSDGKEVYKNKLHKTTGNHTIKLDNNFNINNQVSCVVVKVLENTVSPIVWDSVNKIVTDEKLLSQSFLGNYEATINSGIQNPNFNSHQSELLKENKNLSQMHQSAISKLKSESQSDKKETQSALDLDALFELEEAEELEKLIDKNIEINSVPHKNPVFLEENQNLLSSNGDKEIFIDLIHDQIEDMFAKYPSEERLENLIPNSKWAKVDFENDGHHYVLGLIYDDIALKYICYGVPGEFENTPPKDIEPYSQWLPLDPNDSSAGGYWVMYQDAITGDNIQIELI